MATFKITRTTAETCVVNASSADRAKAYAHTIPDSSYARIDRQYTAEIQPAPTPEELLAEGRKAARAVLANWSSGDLAGAVRDLNDWLQRGGE